MSAKKNKNRTAAGAQKTENAGTPVAAPIINKQENALTAALKEETLIWIFTILSALVVYFVVASVIQSDYHPDINALKEAAGKILIEPGGVRPEPMEAMLFRAGVVVITLCLFVFYALFSKLKMIKELAAKPFFIGLATLCIVVIVAIIYADFAAQNPYVKDGGDIPQNSRDFTGKSNFDFFFDGIFLGKYLLPYTFILVPGLAGLFFWGVKKYNWGNNRLLKMIIYIASGALVLAVVSMNAFNFPYTFENKYDFNAVYYSMTQVYSGVPMLVNGFTNTYGLYPEFLNPIFHIIGLSVAKFSFVMAMLIGIAFVFNFYVLKYFTTNNIILFAGFLTVVFFPFLDFKFVTAFDSLFSIFSVRYIIPSTLAFLATLYFSNGSKIVYWVTFVVMGLFILWNPEIGTVCYLAWLAVNTYRDFYTEKGKVALKKIAFHWLIGVGIVLVVVYAYKSVIYLVYGSSPDLTLLFGTIAVFGKVGFNMLPMVLIHPWNLSMIVLVLGLTYAVSKWYKKQVTPKASIVFLLSLIGIGYFFYFQGRSHNWPYAYSTSFTIMLLTILGDELWTKIKDNNVLPLNALFVVFLFIISFSFFEILFGMGKMTELLSQDDDKSKNTEEQQRIESNTDFILKNSAERERIHVLTAMQYEGLYFGGSKRVSAFNPGFMELFLKTDLTRFEHTIADSSYNIFIEPSLCTFNFMLRPVATIGATYEVRSVNQTMAMLNRRKTKIPTSTFFNGDAIIHRKYNDDTAGIRSRVSDALGIKQVSLNPSFSVEVLFNSKTQVYPYATLVGNMNDSTGFIIASMVNSPNYFFGINGKGSGVPLPANEWVYCVMNVFSDHMEVYINGNLAGSLPIAAPLRQSPEKLCVGNLGYMRNYLGAIAEVAVFNNALDKNQVEATWEQIRSAIGKN